VTTYLTAPEIIALHQQVMDQMDWAVAPLRSEDLLHSAVMRTQSVAYYDNADLAIQATVLAIGISQNQPFLDGNKRAALYALLTFLGINGVEYVGDKFAIADQLVSVAEREGTLEAATDAFAVWLRERLQESPVPETE